jgi:GNAT superfamily N-acetyltransferase
VPRSLVLRDGRLARVRALTEDDAPALSAFVRALSPQARRARFFNAVNMLSAERLHQLLGGSGHSVAAFDLDGRIVAHAQYALAGTHAEFAVVVAEGWRRNRLGAALLWMLKQHAMDAGARTLGGEMLADNQAMRGVATQLGFTFKRAADPVLLRAVYASR